MLRVGMHFVTLCVTDRRRATASRSDAERPRLRYHAERGSDEKALFYRNGTDDAECDVSVRTKSGRKRSRDFAYFDPSKYVAEGRKGALSLEHI